MRLLAWFVVMLISVSLQSTLIPALSIGGVRPDLVLVVVVSAALTSGRETGVLCGVFGGVLQDLLSAGPFGVNTLAKMLVGLCVGCYARKVDERNWLMPLMAVCAGTLGAGVATALFIIGYGRTAEISVLLTQLIPTLAYHILLTAPVHAAILWVKRRQAAN